MADVRVKRTGKDDDGDIISLCGDWGKDSKSEAIRYIENGTHTYYVNEVAPRVNVHVVTSSSGRKHLRTTSDRTSKNNLDNLPNC